MSALPTFFVSHGSPMLSLDAGATGAAWAEIGAALPAPRAIVAVSAHWSQAAPALTGTAQPETIHDFYGFDGALYELHYPAPGAPELARELADGLARAGYAARVDERRGLDHGAWVPLRFMYPSAKLPVLQLSINARADAAWHYQLGAALAPVLGEDVLLLASGGLTHNLYDFRPGTARLPVPDYVTDFQAWMFDRLTARDIDAVLDYRKRAPQALRAHPTDEHLLPLFVALGAAGPDAPVRRDLDIVTERMLAMDIYRFERARAA
ncbi:MAG: dioxygenase [Rhodocyclaceae bacterium]|nr:dioxygenase [Rhodocyclaceae bacterium]MBX3666812.1 dioxygenase [Rhodocyclaceae bacterium]